MKSPAPHTPRPRGRPRGRPPTSKKIPRSAPPAERYTRIRIRRPRDDEDDEDEDVIKAQDITLDDDDDDEDEDEDNDAEEDGEDLDDDEDESNARRKRLRRRATRSSTAQVAEEDEEEDEEEQEEEDGDEDDNDDAGTGAGEAVAGANGELREDPRAAAARKARAARMRNMQARNSASAQTVAPLDLDGNPQQIEGDEVIVPPDAVGDTKVDENGHLKDGREYRCRTFTILGSGDRLYMLSTEPARCIGFRDSYLFFQRHRQLLKVIVDDRQKFDLIERNVIPHSYKGRAIGIVTARSVFREFGARIIVGGRRVTDDYYESRAVADGAVAGELADPFDKLPPPGVEYNRNQYVAWHGASAVYHTQQTNAPTPQEMAAAFPYQLKKKSVIITDQNWMFEHARAASTYNSFLAQQRKKIWTDKGVYEPHTGITMVPEASQPTTCVWEYIPEK
ncbi:chromatin remodelling complex Rsc7/Swp82 subunit-domain-containing protein [Limtongia smithiae]|uniref:chromatin remodelling complex Rsc7/Swp82 subunit-domain-containing protein n=1 Tax=Limtongia smithiae TaxID=1125753 RepID=UPI0034CE2662